VEDKQRAYQHVPETETVTRDSSVHVVEGIVTHRAPDTANFDLQTTFTRKPTRNKSYIYNGKYTKLC